MLNLARAVQGVGGAIMFATSLALIAAAFTGHDRGTAFGIYGAVIGGAVAIGPLIGGAITSGIGWRWIFFVNVPIGAIAVLITFTQIAKSEDLRPRGSTGWASSPSRPASSCWCSPSSAGNDFGWGSTTTISLLVGAAVLMVASSSTSASLPTPCWILAFSVRPSWGSRRSPSCLAASIFAMFLYLTLYIQDDLGYGPLAAGIRFLPMTLVIFFTPSSPGAYGAHRRVPVGHRDALRHRGPAPHGDDPPGLDVDRAAPGLHRLRLRGRIVNPALASGAVSVVQPQRSGMASGANNTFRQVGIATGIAVLGAVFQSQILSAHHGRAEQVALRPGVLRRGGAQLQGAMAAGGVAMRSPPSPSPQRARRCSRPTRWASRAP